MLVSVIGGLGNMGRRYSLILKSLGVKVLPIDVNSTPEDIDDAKQFSDAFIVATPTDTHANWVIKLARLKRPILCEKPISTSLNMVKEVLRITGQEKTPLSMVCQYSELAPKTGSGDSFYNYFRHGNDGLYWDCIQIIALANGKCEVADDSPVWRCQINGKSLNVAEMDHAYIKHLQRWTNGEQVNDAEFIFEAHRRVARITGGLDG